MPNPRCPRGWKGPCGIEVKSVSHSRRRLSSKSFDPGVWLCCPTSGRNPLCKPNHTPRDANSRNRHRREPKILWQSLHLEAYGISEAARAGTQRSILRDIKKESLAGCRGSRRRNALSRLVCAVPGTEPRTSPKQSRHCVKTEPSPQTKNGLHESGGCRV